MLLFNLTPPNKLFSIFLFTIFSAVNIFIGLYEAYLVCCRRTYTLLIIIRFMEDIIYFRRINKNYCSLDCLFLYYKLTCTLCYFQTSKHILASNSTSFVMYLNILYVWGCRLSLLQEIPSNQHRQYRQHQWEIIVILFKDFLFRLKSNFLFFPKGSSTESVKVLLKPIMNWNSPDIFPMWILQILQISVLLGKKQWIA